MLEEVKGHLSHALLPTETADASTLRTGTGCRGFASQCPDTTRAFGTWSLVNVLKTPRTVLLVNRQREEERPVESP